MSSFRALLAMWSFCLQAHSEDLLQELFASSILEECLGMELAVRGRSSVAAIVTGSILATIDIDNCMPTRGMAGTQTPKAFTHLRMFARFFRKQAGP